MVKLWPDTQAEQILKKHGKGHDENAPFIFETGFGPSGKPHFGTFGEVVRTNYVMLALQEKGYKTKLIAFSDDMDGLRKIPENFPAWLKDYIGRPVSAIPDPFETHESYAAHMNALLVKMLEELGLDFEFRSSAESYKNGLFNEQIKIIIQNYEAVQEIVLPTLREETQKDWFPFFPRCEKCGSVGYTRVLDVDKENFLLTYACDREFGGKPGCGHQGQLNPLNGNGKFQWKVDWPARWHAFKVNYEMYGKDLIESATIGDRIMQRIFRTRPPVQMFYEMFLAEDGSKISKSKGTGMTAEDWLRYGTHDSLMMLMLDKPSEAKRLYPGVVPRYMAQTTQGAVAYHSGNEKQARDARLYQFIKLFNPPSEQPLDIDFSTLANLVGNVGLTNPAIVEEYLRRSGLLTDELSPVQQSDLHELIAKARRFYDEQMTLELKKPEFDAEDAFLLGQLVTYLESGNYDGDTIHAYLFQLPRDHDVQPAKFFRAVYNALIKQERGPRGGQFIKLLGQDTAVQLIRVRIQESLAQEEPDIAKPQLESLPVAISPHVRTCYPDLAIGVAVIEGVEINDKRPPELADLINKQIQTVADTDLETALNTGAIATYRTLYESFGTNPNANPPSSEVMLKMAVQENRLPEVNNLVDALNLTVLETGITAALYDMDNLELPLVLRFAREGDKHLPLGSKQIDSVTVGELVYADDNEVICRALNHRDSDKSKITTRTKKILLIVDGSPGIEVMAIYQTLQSHLQRLTHFAGGTALASGLLT